MQTLAWQLHRGDGVCTIQCCWKLAGVWATVRGVGGMHSAVKRVGRTHKGSQSRTSTLIERIHGHTENGLGLDSHGVGAFLWCIQTEKLHKLLQEC